MHENEDAAYFDMSTMAASKPADVNNANRPAGMLYTLI